VNARALGLEITDGSRGTGGSLTRRNSSANLNQRRATQKLLDEFEALPNEDRVEHVAELLRRTALAPNEPPSEDDLVASADRLFVELDRQEQA
jgi:hypothetical protein